jgi:mRNA-degrading endonuclease YafQ of YafQ-DinJ toxin-antitoxin module
MTRGYDMKDFYKSIKNALKRERRKEQKRKSLLRTLTANRLMAEAVRFELTCP